MLSRKFTIKEKILLLILALILVSEAYYLLVHQRVRMEYEEARTRTEAATASLNAENARAAKKEEMLKRIQEVRKDSNVRPLPDYDNATNVVSYLNGVMAATEDYNLVFNTASFSNYVAMRSVGMSFSCQGYSAVKNIVTQLERGPYYCEVTGMSMSAGSGINDATGERVSVRMTAVFYEYVGTGAEAGGKQ